MRIVFLSLILIFSLGFICCASCTKPAKQEPGKIQKQAQAPEPHPATDEYFAPAENLAKRLVLYKLAMQEGDVAPFTARPEEVKDIKIPEIPKQVNSMWWKVEWGTTRLAPLPISEITMLESVVFPLIAVRMDDLDKDTGWCMFTLGYDPDDIKPHIAESHSNWLPEERELYLKGYDDGCLQVWCVKINAEWKLLANISCSDETERPIPPITGGQTQTLSQDNESSPNGSMEENSTINKKD